MRIVFAVIKLLVKRRTATVKQIGKITGTMKVVASSKLPGAQARAARVSPFFESMESGFAHMMDKLKEDSDSKSVLTVIIYTDKVRSIITPKSSCDTSNSPRVCVVLPTIKSPECWTKSP